MKKTFTFSLLTFALALITGAQEIRPRAAFETACTNYFNALKLAHGRLPATNIVDGAHTLRLESNTYAGPGGRGLTVRATWMQGGQTNAVRVLHRGPENWRERAWRR